MNFDNLKAAIAEAKSVEDAAVGLIHHLADEVSNMVANGADDEELQNLADELHAESHMLGAAVTAAGQTPAGATPAPVATPGTNSTPSVSAVGGTAVPGSNPDGTSAALPNIVGDSTNTQSVG